MGVRKLSAIGGTIWTRTQQLKPARVNFCHLAKITGPVQAKAAPIMMMARRLAVTALGFGLGRYRTYLPRPVSSQRLDDCVIASTNAFGDCRVLGCASQVIQPKKRVISANGILSTNVRQPRRF